MSTNTEELLGKFVRTGLIVRHIEGGAPEGQGREPGFGREGRGHGHEGHEGRRHGHEGREGETGHEGHGRGHGHEEHGDARVHEGREGGRCHGGREGREHGQGQARKGHGARCQGQARVLSMVALKEGINQKDLAFLLGIRPQTLGEMLQKLEERGLVERRKSEADARAIEVTLTDAGRERAQSIEEHRKLAAADIFSVLTDEEKEQLDAILDKLGAELDKHRPKHVR